MGKPVYDFFHKLKPLLGLTKLDAQKNYAPLPDYDYGIETQGFDYQGQEKTCISVDISSMNCTKIATAAGAYGSECKSKGFIATACGCHDYICSHQLNE